MSGTGRKPALLGLVLLGGAAFLAARAARATAERPRAIELVETVRVRAPQGAKTVRLWIPKPPSEGPQTAELLSVEAPASHRITSEAEFGNELVYLRASPKGGEPLDVTLRYRIVRRPQEGRASTAPEPASLAPRGLLAINDEIREIARRQTHGLSTPEEKGRALYDFVLKRMEYDKSGTGWGRGDSIYACRVGKGNCTDFHSLFMALAIASGLPARFRMGFSLPPPSEGDVDGYHCWAEFHAEGSGWIPVDISAAWKNPGREDFYFGRLDGSRVLVSTGREIRLSPPQSGGRLNFLSRPYAEADGQPIHDIEFTRRYKDEKAPRASYPQG